MSTVDNLIKYFSEEQNPKIEENIANSKINKNKQHISNHCINYEFNYENKNNSKNFISNREIGNNVSNITNLPEKDKLLINKKIKEIKKNDSEKNIENKKEKNNEEEILEGNNTEIEKMPGTPYLKTKKGKIKEIVNINNSDCIETKQIKEKENSIMPPVFIETIHAKIVNSENDLYNEYNNNINYNRKISFGGENNDENNGESEDNTYKEEEKFLEKEEKKRKKEGLALLKEKIKENNVIEIIEENDEKKEEEDEEIDEISIKNISLKNNIERNRKKIFENENYKKNDEKKFNEDKKFNKKENKNDNFINSQKYREKMNAKKKQLSNTILNNLYNNGNKKDKEKEKENNLINKKQEKKVNNKNNKIFKTFQNESSHLITKKKIETIVIDDSSSEENNESNYSQRKDNNFPKITELKTEKKNNNHSKLHKKQNTNQNFFNKDLFIQNCLKESKNLESINKKEQNKKYITLEERENEICSFTPEINQKSINLCNKKNIKRKNSSSLNTSNYESNSYINNRRLNISVGDLLYEDSANKMKKLENMSISEKMNLKKDVNKSFISKGSVNLLIKKTDIKLNEIIDKYSKNNNSKLKFINIIQCLWDLHILRELFKYTTRFVEEIDLEYVITIVKDIINTKIKSRRQIVEIEFVEQFWIKINPNYENENDYIEKENLYQFLKILFNLNEKTEMNKMINKVENFLKTINRKEINNKNKRYNSLLRNKEFEKNEIWPISKFIRVFFELKQLLSKYRKTKKDEIMENIKNERDKELTFQPDFNATTSYFRKKIKTEKDEDILSTSINSSFTNRTTFKKQNFNKLYKEFMIKKQMHEKALMILRENKFKKEIKMCTDKPKINKEFKIKNRNKTPDIGLTRNEFLYNLNKDILNKKKELIIQKENEYKKYSFRPNITNNEVLMNKSFMEGGENKPKGSEEYIKRNRSFIEFKKREKIKEENRIIGKNYEKIKNKKVILPKIKDLEPNTNISIQKDKRIEDDIKNIINNEFFIIQIKTAKGRIKPLKIYIHNNPIETVYNFCIINNIKKETKEKIIKKVKELTKIYEEIKSYEDKK